MVDKERFEQVMQNFNTYGKGRSLRSYCKDEDIDYKWVLDCKREYPKETRTAVQKTSAFLPVELTEEEPKPKTWEVDNLTLKSPDGEIIHIKTNSLSMAVMILNKISLP